MKSLYITLLVLLMLTVTSCSFKNDTIHQNLNHIEANEKGFVVVGHVGQYNIEKLERFYQNFLDGKKAKATIIEYSTEGNPLYTVLDYNGKQLKYTFDNTWDGFGPPDKGPKTTSCEAINTKETINNDRKGTEYILINCIEKIGLMKNTNEFTFATIYDFN